MPACVEMHSEKSDYLEPNLFLILLCYCIHKYIYTVTLIICPSFSSYYTGILPRAEVGFQFTQFTVPEDVGLKTACVVLLSGGPVQMFSAFRVSSRDGTAESLNSGKH